MTSIKIQNFERLQAINNDIYKRNIPSSNIQMNFSPRPVITKYSKMSILDHREPPTVLINNTQHFNNNIFYPGTRKLDYCGFAINVDKESTLRNQFFALQKSDQAAWMPSSNSDLYENNINIINTSKNLDETLLFQSESFNDFDPNISSNIGNNIFHNATRVQLKNL